MNVWKPHTTFSLAHWFALIASQLSVKYTSENRKTNWITAIFVCLASVLTPQAANVIPDQAQKASFV